MRRADLNYACVLRKQVSIKTGQQRFGSVAGHQWLQWCSNLWSYFSVRQLLAPPLCWVCVIVDGVKLYRGIVDRSDTPRLTDTDHIHCSGRTTQCSYNEL